MLGGYNAAVSPPAATATCRMVFHGTSGGAVRNASLSCVNGTITAAGDQYLLGKDSFQGAVWDQTGCGDARCLLTLCGSTNALFVNSIVENINATDSLDGIICIRGSSEVRFERAVFANNTAINGTLHALDKAKVSLVDSVITGNTAYGGDSNVTAVWNLKGAGAGLYARERAEVTISNSTIAHNKASRSGGGIWVQDSVVLALVSSNVSQNNAVKNGGGFFAEGTSHVTISNYSAFSSNNASIGGGAFAAGNATIIVSNHSTFTRNNARFGGGAAARANTTFKVTSYSTFSSTAYSACILLM
eukprot:jgi/Chrzof1/1124/Cz01g41040.t1